MEFDAGFLKFAGNRRRHFRTDDPRTRLAPRMVDNVGEAERLCGLSCASFGCSSRSLPLRLLQTDFEKRLRRAASGSSISGLGRDAARCSVLPGRCRRLACVGSRPCNRCAGVSPRVCRAAKALLIPAIDYAQDEVEETVKQQAAERGLEAHGLAQKLRHHYHLRSRPPVWDHVPGFRK